MERLIQRSFEALGPSGTISFAFQGGEPLLAGLDFFKAFVTQVRTSCPENVSVNYAIQTNGLLLTKEWSEFLKENHFLVGVSLDGWRENHDRFRRAKRPSAGWDTALHAARQLIQAGVPVNALCVVTKPVAEEPDRAYQTLKQLGFRFQQYIACLDPCEAARGQQPYSLKPDLYRKFLCRLFDLWYADWKRGDYVSVRLFEDYIHLLLRDGASTCSTCGQCGGYLLVEADGTVYPCDFFALDKWALGHIQDRSFAELATSKAAGRFLGLKEYRPKKCASCSWEALCNGGCKRDWEWQESEGSLQTKNYYCHSFETFFRHAFPRLCEIAEAERQAR